MIVPIEIVILISGIAALILSAVTVNSLDKLKKSCGAAYDKKHYDTARNTQIAQLVLSVLVIILSGWVVIGTVAAKKGRTVPGASSIGRLARGLVA
jgi:hypothetical protein